MIQMQSGLNLNAMCFQPKQFLGKRKHMNDMKMLS